MEARELSPPLPIELASSESPKSNDSLLLSLISETLSTLREACGISLSLPLISKGWSPSVPSLANLIRVVGSHLASNKFAISSLAAQAPAEVTPLVLPSSSTGTDSLGKLDVLPCLPTSVTGDRDLLGSSLTPRRLLLLELLRWSGSLLLRLLLWDDFLGDAALLLHPSDSPAPVLVVGLAGTTLLTHGGNRSSGGLFSIPLPPLVLEKKKNGLST